MKKLLLLFLVFTMVFTSCVSVYETRHQRVTIRKFNKAKMGKHHKEGGYYDRSVRKQTRKSLEQ